MKQIPVFIDTDPGIDDFFALMLANSSSVLDIRGITAVAGNQVLEKTAQNILDISNYLGIHTRLAKGAAKPLNRALRTAGEVHGESGLGQVVLPHVAEGLEVRYAWDVMYEEAKKAEGRLQIIAVGPLTNVAIALLKYPDLPQYLERIVIMGGSAGVGNHAAYSEFNIWVDPEAADIVFKSGITLVMVGLDVTMQALLDEKDIKALSNRPSRIAKEVKVLLEGMKEVYARFGVEGVALHDALAVAYVIQPDVLSCYPYYVTVETRGELNAGRTVVDLDHSHRDKKPNVSVAMKVNTSAFVRLLEQMIDYYNQ